MFISLGPLVHVILYRFSVMFWICFVWRPCFSSVCLICSWFWMCSLFMIMV